MSLTENPGRDSPGRLKLKPGMRNPGDPMPGKEIPGRRTAAGPSGVLRNSKGESVVLFNFIKSGSLIGGVFVMGTAMAVQLIKSVIID
jgi:hypothetical protein